MNKVTLTSESGNRNVYLIHSTDDDYYTCSLLCGSWLLSIEKLDWIQHMKCDVYFRSSYTMKPWSTPPSSEYEWVFNFPLVEDDKYNIYHIAKFFESFNSRVDLKLTERIEHCVDTVKGHLTSEVMNRLVRFASTEKYDSKERIRLLLSPKVQHYLQSQKEILL